MIKNRGKWWDRLQYSHCNVKYCSWQPGGVGVPAAKPPSDSATTGNARDAHNFTARLSPAVFTLEEFIRGATKGQSPVADIIRDGRLVCGQSLREVMRG
jgi:hypothetical protein